MCCRKELQRNRLRGFRRKVQVANQSTTGSTCPWKWIDTVSRSLRMRGTSYSSSSLLIVDVMIARYVQYRLSCPCFAISPSSSIRLKLYPISFPHLQASIAFETFRALLKFITMNQMDISRLTQCLSDLEKGLPTRQRQIHPNLRCVIMIQDCRSERHVC